MDEPPKDEGAPWISLKRGCGGREGTEGATKVVRLETGWSALVSGRRVLGTGRFKYPSVVLRLPTIPYLPTMLCPPTMLLCPPTMLLCPLTVVLCPPKVLLCPPIVSLRTASVLRPY